MEYALNNPIKRKVYVPEDDTPFALAFTPTISAETDQTHRSMVWQHDNRQKVIGTQTNPESARLDKKK